MNFLYPVGLWGLIGIPILIIIYIIKSKYAEQTVSSTYLWTLSEKFLKKRKPIDRVTGIISLILQILAVTLISLALARPVVILEDAADEYCFILDASGSMNMVDASGKTRFDTAKDEIAAIIDSSFEGSVYSLISVGDTTQIIFEQTDSREQAKKLLSEAEVSYGSEQYVDALGAAQRYFDENPGINTYLVTDKSYKTNKNIELLNVAAEGDNYMITNVTYTLLKGQLVVNGNLTTYEEDGNLVAELYVDDGDQPVASGRFVTTKGEATSFQLVYNTKKFSSFTVKIYDEYGDIMDAMSMDNEVHIYNRESEQIYKTLIVSDTPFFFESAISSISNAEIDIMATKDYTSDVKGYGLYIFDSVDPQEVPSDGAVWFINPRGSVEGSGFSVQGQITPEGGADRMELSKASSSLAKTLTDGLTGKDIYVSKYIKCGLYNKFTTIMSYRSHPVIFAGTNGYGNREVVFAFSLHDTNFPMMMDYVYLINNLLRYSFPDIIEDVSYYVGEQMSVNVITNCESIRVETPSGELTYLDISSGVGECILGEAGTYKVTLTVAGTDRQFKVYSELPVEERIPHAEAEELSLQGEAEAGGLDGEYDPLLIILICLVIVFAADWMVYCYEKYQLR